MRIKEEGRGSYVVGHNNSHHHCCPDWIIHGALKLNGAPSYEHTKLAKQRPRRDGRGGLARDKKKSLWLSSKYTKYSSSTSSDIPESSSAEKKKSQPDFSHTGTVQKKNQAGRKNLRSCVVCSIPDSVLTLFFFFFHRILARKVLCSFPYQHGTN